MRIGPVCELKGRFGPAGQYCNKGEQNLFVITDDRVGMSNNYFDQSKSIGL